VSSRSQSAEVFVVGGGPAGLATAIAASQKGFRVTVADGAAPFIDKPCGEGMMPETIAALRSLGVEIAPHEGRKFRGISFVQELQEHVHENDRAQQEVRVFADFPQGCGIGMRRHLLHKRLIARAEECGVELLWNTPVVGIEAPGADRVNVKLSCGSISARWVIGADGQGSRVRRWSGLEAGRRTKLRHACRRHYRVRPWSEYVEIYWGRHSQVYVTPVGVEEVCVAVMWESGRHVSFDRALCEFPRLNIRLTGAQLASRERGAVTSMHSLKHVQRGNVALVGDASGSVDPITGEGMRLAFRQAFALAESLVANDLRAYEQAHRELARRPRLMGHAMLWLGRRPRMRARLIHGMAAKPDLFAALLALHMGQGSPASLLSNGALLGWRFLAHE
jgi:menaquinone-9 beta-reductase